SRRRHTRSIRDWSSYVCSSYLFVKLAGDLPAIQKTFFRNLISAIIAFAFVIYNKERLFGKRENQLVLLARSIFGTLRIVFLFYRSDDHTSALMSRFDLVCLLML